MVTGKRAFQRSTAAETWWPFCGNRCEPIGRKTATRPLRCVGLSRDAWRKEPDKRYVSTRDLARELAAIRDRFSEKPVKQVETRPANLPVQRTGLWGERRK
jgi:hypothetical protein